VKTTGRVQKERTEQLTKKRGPYCSNWFPSNVTSMSTIWTTLMELWQMKIVIKMNLTNLRRITPKVIR
jgi:hypothetical protein